MPQTLREAFTNHGMRAEFRGNPAMILPLTQDMIDDFAEGEAENRIGQEISAGQLLASWNEDGQRRGMVLNPNAGNDITFMVPRNDGTEARVPAGDLKRAAVNLISMARESERDHERVARENAENAEAHARAVEAGEAESEFEPAEPTFPEGAFRKVPEFVDCVQSGAGKTLADPFADIVAKSQAYAARFEIGRENANVLTPEEMGKVTTARALREEIGALSADHPQALTPADAPYQGDNDAARDLMSDMRIPGRGFSQQQMAAIAANPVISREVFAVLTTTPASSLAAKQLSTAGYEAATQELGRHEERNWAPEALDRVSRVLQERIPGYEFEARLFQKDEADILLVRDHVGTYMYGWDSASRVAEIDVDDKILSTYTREDVPTDEQIHELRVTLQDLRYDTGDEIDFGFADEDDELADPEEQFGQEFGVEMD